MPTPAFLCYEKQPPNIPICTRKITNGSFAGFLWIPSLCAKTTNIRSSLRHTAEVLVAVRTRCVYITLSSFAVLEHRPLFETATLLSSTIDDARTIDQQTGLRTSPVCLPSEAVQHRLLAIRNRYTESCPSVTRT